jgi:hypothetical protein
MRRAVIWGVGSPTRRPWTLRESAHVSFSGSTRALPTATADPKVKRSVPSSSWPTLKVESILNTIPYLYYRAR